ncbi:MAG: cytochrome c family protein [Magnetococcales bacterium]|nr:cytochrome c family protein [Magnetococcales bacterium]
MFERSRAFILGLLMLLALSPFGQASAVMPSPQSSVGPQACADCHKEANRIWAGTRHGKSYPGIEQVGNAREIMKRMEIRSMEKEANCAGCHITRVEKDGAIASVSGPSCESCHGGAKKWLDVHGNYGGKDVKKEQETPEHKKTRLAESTAAGRIAASELPTLIRGCYTCHFGHDEKLVNVGDHGAGSKLEPDSWLHDTVAAGFTPLLHRVRNQSEVEPLPRERRREIFVAGKMLELEFSLRAVAKATQNAPYAKAFAQRVKAVVAALTAIHEKSPIPEVGALLQAVNPLPEKIKLNNAAVLEPLADQVASRIDSFWKRAPGAQLAAIDALMTGPAK